MLPVLLSIGALNALIPLIIILILIAAAAGITRGWNIFALFGISTLIGMGVAGKGTLRGKSASSVNRKLYKGGVAGEKLTKGIGKKYQIANTVKGKVLKTIANKMENMANRSAAKQHVRRSKVLGAITKATGNLAYSQGSTKQKTAMEAEAAAANKTGTVRLSVAGAANALSKGKGKTQIYQSKLKKVELGGKSESNYAKYLRAKAQREEQAFNTLVNATIASGGKPTKAALKQFYKDMPRENLNLGYLSGEAKRLGGTAINAAKNPKNTLKIVGSLIAAIPSGYASLVGKGKFGDIAKAEKKARHSVEMANKKKYELQEKAEENLKKELSKRFPNPQKVQEYQQRVNKYKSERTTYLREYGQNAVSFQRAIDKYLQNNPSTNATIANMLNEYKKRMPKEVGKSIKR